ncbi:MAG: acetylornithine deacetylase, partial [Gammaproteobacteria bacterium]|nr:acetylornithine deacetylase [Gammaproteobacteria bacterium]
DFDIKLMPVPSAAGSEQEKLNLVASLGEGDDGLVLAGHTDTVPWDESAWSFNPFSLTEKDGRLYGLGTSDMKCLFPLAIEAVQTFTAGDFKSPLTILATADEESSMAGAKALKDSGLNPGAHALIGEPTGLTPVIKHKGIFIERIELIGQSGHSSDPALGNSALEGMNTVINRLLEWRTDLQSRFRDEAFRVPVPTMNLGAIRGGDNPNRICASCELSMDLRLLPGMTLAEIKTALHEKVRSAIADTGLKVSFNGNFDGVAGMDTDPDAEIVRLAEKLTGKPATSVAFGTEGPYFNAMGMNTVILGPGDIEVAHQADEYIHRDRLQPMQNILEHMIRHFCVKK